MNKIEELQKLVKAEIPTATSEIEASPSEKDFFFLDIHLGSNFVICAWQQGFVFLVGKLNCNTPDDCHECLDVKSAMAFIKQEFFSNN